MEKPVFDSPEDMLRTTFLITTNHLVFLDRLLFGLVHLTLLVIAMLAGWWFEVTPSQAKAAASAAFQQEPLASAQAVGLSIAGLVTGYLALARFVWMRTAWPWLYRRMLQGT